MPESRITVVQKQMARQLELVDRQRQLVRRLAAAGMATGPALLLLRSAEQTLQLFRQELRRLEANETLAPSPARAHLIMSRPEQ